MKSLTKHEELFMLTIFRLNKPATVTDIRDHFLRNTGKDLAFASLYLTLEKLYQKGYVSSEVGDLKTALADLNSIVLSERAAAKYFGKINPIGKVIKLENQVDLTVTGVIKNVPTNSHMQFDLVARPEVFLDKVEKSARPIKYISG